MPTPAQPDEGEISCLRLPCGASGWPEIEQSTGGASENQSVTHTSNSVLFHQATLARTEPLCPFCFPPLQGQGEPRSKFPSGVEGKQNKDTLSSLPGAAVGEEGTSAPKLAAP